MARPSPDDLRQATETAVEHMKVAYTATTGRTCHLDDETVLYCILTGYCEAVDDGDLETFEFNAVNTMLEMETNGSNVET